MDDPSDQLKENPANSTEPAEETSSIEGEKPEQPEEQHTECQANAEFTYFSLGSKPDEAEEVDEAKPAEKAEQSQASMEKESQETKEDLEPKVDQDQDQSAEEHEESGSECDSADQLDIKKLPFDELIDKVRQNQVANKDVCNYVLNMLVDGEFDLEKNFVIKNHTTILLMMQVIKCADGHLKAELWSLFTAILRKSYLNLQACVDIGLVETALHELEGADQVCADLIVEMLTVLANYNITVEELKAVFSWLKGEDQFWVREN